MGSITFMELSNLRERRETWGYYWRMYKEGVIFALVVALAGTVLGLGIKRAVNRDRAYAAESHQAWVKLTGRSDITLEEWKALKNSGALNNK